MMTVTCVFSLSTAVSNSPADKGMTFPNFGLKNKETEMLSEMCSTESMCCIQIGSIYIYHLEATLFGLVAYDL